MADTTISSLNTVNALSANNFVPISDGTTTTKLGTDSLFGFRNRIINGDMRIDQRNAGAAVTVNNGSIYITDRFAVIENTDIGVISTQRSTTAPSNFTNSLSITTTTADTTLVSSDNSYIYHAIEGNNVNDLGWGTASAKTVTLSFWVRSSLTGTFGGSMYNDNNDRSYPFTYTISSANTWEQKTITVAGDTSGTWQTNNSAGIKISWNLGTGSLFSGTAGSWSSNLYVSATGATSVIGTLNATFFLTGVQLEAGPTATPFERRFTGTELALCQRYFVSMPSEQRLTIQTSQNEVVSHITLPVPMRILNPSVSLNPSGLTSGGSILFNTPNPFWYTFSSFNTATAYSSGLMTQLLTLTFTGGSNPGVYPQFGTLLREVRFSAEL